MTRGEWVLQQVLDAGECMGPPGRGKVWVVICVGVRAQPEARPWSWVRFRMPAAYPTLRRAVGAVPDMVIVVFEESLEVVQAGELLYLQLSEAELRALLHVALVAPTAYGMGSAALRCADGFTSLVRKGVLQREALGWILGPGAAAVLAARERFRAVARKALRLPSPSRPVTIADDLGEGGVRAFHERADGRVTDSLVLLPEERERSDG